MAYRLRSWGSNFNLKGIGPQWITLCPALPLLPGLCKPMIMLALRQMLFHGVNKEPSAEGLKDPIDHCSKVDAKFLVRSVLYAIQGHS